MAIQSPQGYVVTSNEAIDNRLILTKEQMRYVNDGWMPQYYFCLCADPEVDGTHKIYLYDKDAERNDVTGKFELYVGAIISRPVAGKGIDPVALATSEATIIQLAVTEPFTFDADGKLTMTIELADELDKLNEAINEEANRATSEDAKHERRLNTIDSEINLLNEGLDDVKRTIYTEVAAFQKTVDSELKEINDDIASLESNVNNLETNKQNKLTVDNSLTLTAASNLSVKHDATLQVNGANGLGVDIDNETIVLNATKGLEVNFDRVQKDLVVDPGLELTSEGYDERLSVLFDDLIGDSEETIYLRTANGKSYLAVKNVLLNGAGSAKGTLKDIIPASAGSTTTEDPTGRNRLVDYDTFISALTSNMGTFRGTYESQADLETAWPYSSAADKNDYAFVANVTSEGTFYDRYKCTKTATGDNWVYEYRIATSAFTPDQWKSLESMATKEDIADLNRHITNVVELVPQNTQAVYKIKHDNQGHITASTFYQPNWNEDTTTLSDHILNRPAVRKDTTTASGVKIGDFTNNVASGANSVAEGTSTTASGNSAHAEGQGTVALGGNSHTEGWNSRASGGNAHTEGGDTEASGLDSHAEGLSTTASGMASHAEGMGTKALALGAHAEGSITEAHGENSHAEGE